MQTGTRKLEGASEGAGESDGLERSKRGGRCSCSRLIGTFGRTLQGNPDMSSPGKDFGQQLSDQINDALSRLASKEMFQTDWDIAAFAIFFIFIGAVLALVLLVLIRCLCCCCCDCEHSGSYQKASRKVGIDNQAMEP